jgi:hypothetical protein
MFSLVTNSPELIFAPIQYHITMRESSPSMPSHGRRAVFCVRVYAGYIYIYMDFCQVPPPSMNWDEKSSKFVTTLFSVLI